MYALVTSLAFLALGAGPEPVLRIDGRPPKVDVPVHIVGEDVWVGFTEFAGAFGKQAKVVVPQKLAVLCDDVVCIPVHLSPGDLREVSGVRLIKLNRVAEATGYLVSRDGNRIELHKVTSSDVRMEELAAGAMLPDVALTDLTGKQVRISDFLGRRILICTWASW